MYRSFHSGCKALRRGPGPVRSVQNVPDSAKIIYKRAGQLEPGVEIKQLSEIQSGLNDRYYEQYLIPSKEWCRDNGTKWGGMKNYLNMDLMSLSEKQQADMDASLEPKVYDKTSETFRLVPKELLKSPLKIGDLVLLRSNPTQLCTCVEVPTDVMNPSYAFATIDGQIKYAMRSMILLRIPSFHRRSAHHLIREEKPYLDARIGTVKDSPEKTFILPILARQLYTSYAPFKITKQAWSRMAILTQKLELLHRFLQRSSGPWQVSIFKLCQMAVMLDLEKFRSSHAESYIKELFQKLGLNGSPNSFQKQSGNLHYIESVDAADYLATFWALEQQQENNLWGQFQTHQAMLAPLSVTVLPLASRHLYYETVLKDLKKDNHRLITKFAGLVNSGNFTGADSEVPQFKQILKDYAAGNFHNNGAMATVVSKLFRSIDVFKGRDITRDLCHELMEKLSHRNTLNPLLLSDDLALPSSSANTALEEKIYEMAQPSTKEDIPARFDFSSMNVYCIDSESAHEIDDGISIEPLGRNAFTLHIHIADPVSLFTEDGGTKFNDEVWNIAYRRGFTTYLPDLVLPMLPQSFCLAGSLGINNGKSKTVSFSVNIKMHDGGLRIDEESFKVRLGYATKFPKVTYDSVDRILQQNNDKTQEAKELRTLYQISLLLQSKRINEQRAIIFGEGFNRGLVKLNEGESGRLDKIGFEDQSQTPSTVLVSEMMILANTLAGRYFQVNKIPGVFRCYKELLLKSGARESYESLRAMTQSTSLPAVEDIAKLSSLLNSSFYTGTPDRHSMIGAPAYLTVTSPLRRFPDLINHLQIRQHLTQNPLPFSKLDIDEMIWHLQSRDLVIRKAARDSASFWTLKHLKSLQDSSPDRKISVMVTSIPRMGFVRCVLPDLSAARGILKLKPEVSADVAIGDLMHNCVITKLDCLDAVMELKMV